MNKAISTENLVKQFARTTGYRDLLPFREKQYVKAVQGISLDVKEGEFFGLLGPNGAGKTTLIKLLCCLILPDAGSARIFDHDVVKEEQIVKNLVGLVSSEERSFYWRLTGRENLEFFSSLYHLRKPAAKQRIDYLLDLLGLTDKADIRFHSYSTGMRQKLAIARGLLSEPRLLFVDEPTRSLDPVSAQTVRNFLKEKVVGQGITVVLATHNLSEAEQLCDRIAIMQNGKVKALGSVRDLRSIFQTKEKCVIKLKGFSDTILHDCANIAGVLDCEIADSQNGIVKLALTLTKREEVLPFILQAIVENGSQIYDCQLSELALEEIFIHALENKMECVNES